MIPPSSNGELEQLINGISTKRGVLSQNIAMATFLICNYTNNLPDEVQYIWPSKWNVGKILYLVIHYSIFVDVVLGLVSLSGTLAPESCRKVVAAQEWLFVLGIGFTGIMLSLRTWIIWMQNRSIAYILSSLFIIIWGCLFWLLIGNTQRLSFATPQSPLQGCYKVIQHINLLLIEVLIAAFETILIVMTWIRIIRDRKMGFGKPRSPVVSILYQDGFLNRVYILVVVSVAVLSIGSKASLDEGLISWERLVHALLGSKMLLHLRMASEGRSPPSTKRTLIEALTKTVSLVYGKSKEGQGSPSSFAKVVSQDIETWFAPPDLIETEGIDCDEIMMISKDTTEETRSTISPNG